MRDVVQSKVKLFRTVLFIRINLVVKDEMGRKSNWEVACRYKGTGSDTLIVLQSVH